MKLQDRYASAINSKNLAVDPLTTQSDSDVLGAMGIADKRLNDPERPRGWRAPLSVPLNRLLQGDGRASGEIIEILTDIVRHKAKSLRVEISQTQAHDMAKAVLGWYRNPKCRPCAGRGALKPKGSPALTGHKCQACGGSGNINLEKHFRDEHTPLVRALQGRMDRELPRAGEEAMKALAPRLDL